MAGNSATLRDSHAQSLVSKLPDDFVGECAPMHLSMRKCSANHVSHQTEKPVAFATDFSVGEETRKRCASVGENAKKVRDTIHKDKSK